MIKSKRAKKRMSLGGSGIKVSSNDPTLIEEFGTAIKIVTK